MLRGIRQQQVHSFERALLRAAKPQRPWGGTLGFANHCVSVYGSGWQRGST